MTLDLDLEPEHLALADSAARFAGSVLARTPGFSEELWRGLGDLGVLGLGTEEVGGDDVHLVAVMDALGHAVCPGPFGATAFAARLVEGSAREHLLAGRHVAGVAASGLVPWGPQADVLVEVVAGEAWLAEPIGPGTPVASLAGDPWSRQDLRRTARLGPTAVAAAAADLATAAWLVGAGRHVLGLAVEHAKGRQQFGRPIGDFQAVAHPLARWHAELGAAWDLLRLAAARGDGPDARDHARAAFVVARRASLEAAYASHQVFGALGFSRESGIGRISAAIRQASIEPPWAPPRRPTPEPTDPPEQPGGASCGCTT